MGITTKLGFKVHKTYKNEHFDKSKIEMNNIRGWGGPAFEKIATFLTLLISNAAPPPLKTLNRLNDINKSCTKSCSFLSYVVSWRPYWKWCTWYWKRCIQENNRVNLDLGTGPWSPSLGSSLSRCSWIIIKKIELVFWRWAAFEKSM